MSQIILIEDDGTARVAFEIEYFGAEMHEDGYVLYQAWFKPTQDEIDAEEDETAVLGWTLEGRL